MSTICENMLTLNLWRVHIFYSGHIPFLAKPCSTPWWDYINFRDYLNAFPEKARSYDDLKCRLAMEYSQDRGSYTQSKQELIAKLLAEAACWRKNISINS